MYMGFITGRTRQLKYNIRIEKNGAWIDRSESRGRIPYFYRL